ncbi:hypothetical protein VULLAG_LOCUS13965 [Vulpes lagopus]
MPRYGLEAAANRPGSGRRCSGRGRPLPHARGGGGGGGRSPDAAARDGPGGRRGWIQHGGAEPEPREETWEVKFLAKYSGDCSC